MNYSILLTALLPELFVVLSLFAALGVDYGLLRHHPLPTRSRIAASIACIGLVIGIAVIIGQMLWFAPRSLGQDQLVLTSLTLGAKALLFGLATVVCILSADHAPNTHVSEYYALILLSTLGAGFLVCTENLLLIFVALELVSLSLYALTAFNKSSRASAEAGLKYFTFGAVSSAFLLFGLSYFYGVVQTLNLHDATLAITSLEAIPPLLRVAILLILVGLGFKVAMAPFHFWVPDVYQSAPTPVAAWIASGSKVAGFFVLIKILQPVAITPSTKAIWAGGVALGATLSLLIGNLGALRQSNLKRLLAYSAVGHAGYMLIGVLSGTVEGMAAVIFYVVIYALANLGAFGVINLVSDRNGLTADIQDIAGCWKRSPLLALLTAVFFLSLAGIPPLAGFIGKFYLFFSAIEAQPAIAKWYEGAYWLVGLALIMSAVSLYYYLRVLKVSFVSDPSATPAPIRVTNAEWICLGLLALLLITSGLFPDPIIHFIRCSLVG